jgi:hypothetical protein
VTDTPLPPLSSRVRCVTNRDRPELDVDRVYVVVHEEFLDRMPINHSRFQPDDFRLIAVKMPDGAVGIFPFGVFEVVR